MLTIKKSLYPILILAMLITKFPASSYAQKTFTREIKQEVAASKNSLIRIVTASRKLTIKSWDQPKLKVTVELTYDSSGVSRTDENWFEDLGISIKPFTNRVDIFSRTYVSQNKLPTKQSPTKQPRYDDKRSPAPGKPIKREIASDVMIRKVVAAKSDIRNMTIMVPAGSRLDIENKYGDVIIGMNLEEAKLEISNGTLDAQDIKDLTLTSDYCNVNLGNIEKAEVEFYNGTFRAQNIRDLDMDSRSSTIEYEKGDYLYLRSQTDEINIHEIKKVDSRKVYGSIKIDQLNESFDLEGSNVDIKFRNILPEVSLIKINNKYGDLRLPVKNLKNYFVDFTGYYSTVFSAFQKQIVKEDEAKKTDEETEKIAILKASQHYKPGGTVGELAPSRFTSTVGDIKGKHTRIELICNSCTVDFK